jgi:hypothetical protein
MCLCFNLCVYVFEKKVKKWWNVQKVVGSSQLANPRYHSVPVCLSIQAGSRGKL